MNILLFAVLIIRAEIQSTDQSQIEAGMSLSLNRCQVFRLVVLKPAIVNIYRPSLAR